MIGSVGGRMRGLGQPLARLGLGIWFVLSVGVCATLLGRHLIALPRPANDAALAQATNALGGALEIESQLHRGTTLRMVFPKASMALDSRPLTHASSTAAA
jgi:hypothetical protein